MTAARTLGFCSISALDRPLQAVAAVARNAGCDALEVTARPPHLDPQAGPEAARLAGRAVRDEGLEVVAYGSYLGRFGQVGEGVAKREVALAAALGTKLLRVWAEPIEGGFDAVVALLRETADLAAREDITVVVERHMGSFADEPDRIDALFRAIDRENVALNYQVLDFLPPARIAEQPDDARRLVPRARYFHLKNYRPNPDGGPLLPGGSLAEGALDTAAILRAALEAGYAGPLTIEFLSFDPRPLEEKLQAEVTFVRRVLAGSA